MKFGPVSLDAAEGAILAHSFAGAERRLRKGLRLTRADIDVLQAEGVSQVTVVRFEPGDVSEDDAATRLGACLKTAHCHLTEAFTGRVNLVADKPGVLRVSGPAVVAMNRVDEGMTLATLADYMKVEAGQLVATVKIIPYGLSDDLVVRAEAALADNPITLHPFRAGRVQLVMTRTPGFKESLLKKGEAVIAERVAGLGHEIASAVTVDHRAEAVADVLDRSADMILILGASATSDRADVAPAGVIAAGGQIDRFGMPVDPGNLLFLGSLGDAAVIGLPGCARSPALNGVDWVLERLAAGLAVDGDAISAMGVGGLLKEMPGRPQPRQQKR